MCDKIYLYFATISNNQSRIEHDTLKEQYTSIHSYICILFLLLLLQCRLNIRLNSPIMSRTSSYGALSHCSQQWFKGFNTIFTVRAKRVSPFLPWFILFKIGQKCILLVYCLKQGLIILDWPVPDHLGSAVRLLLPPPPPFLSFVVLNTDGLSCQKILIPLLSLLLLLSLLWCKESRKIEVYNRRSEEKVRESHICESEHECPRINMHRH